MPIHNMAGCVRKTLAVASLLALVAGVGGCSGEPQGQGPSSAGSATASAKWTTTDGRSVPDVGSSFHIQYSGNVDLNLPVDAYNLDWESTTAEQVAQLTQRGVYTICYFNAGAYEDWRPDEAEFPAALVGKDLDGWPGERWLDVRAVDELLPIMAARMDICRQKGFQAVDPDNTDGWTQDTGFDISPQDQVEYQRALTREAHTRGLSIGLKNNPDQLDQLAGDVDFAVNEECVRYRECDKYTDFLAAGKAVFNIEYGGSPARVCPGRPAGMYTVIKDRKLSAKSQSC